MLEHYCGTDWHEICPCTGAVFQIAGVDGLEFAPLPVTSKPPPYSLHRSSPRAGDNIALGIHGVKSGNTLFYAPGLAAIDSSVWSRMSQANAVIVDGSFWSDDEMIAKGLGRKRAHEMGHLALSGETGMLSFLRRLPRRIRKILIHINNSNPILDENSAERGLLNEEGIEVAYDGMTISF